MNNAMLTKRVLVTGGAGYIGSHVVLQLVAAGERVVVISRNSLATSTLLEIIAGDDTDDELLHAQPIVCGTDREDRAVVVATLAPAERAYDEDWAVFHDRPVDTRIRHAAINFGAFGDRRVADRPARHRDAHLAADPGAARPLVRPHRVAQRCRPR